MNSRELSSKMKGIIKWSRNEKFRFVAFGHQEVKENSPDELPREKQSTKIAVVGCEMNYTKLSNVFQSGSCCWPRSKLVSDYFNAVF